MTYTFIGANYAELEAQADAHLIAAAPDLLAALEYLLEQTIGQDQQYGVALTEGEAIAEQKALAAITKAKGN